MNLKKLNRCFCKGLIATLLTAIAIANQELVTAQLIVEPKLTPTESAPIKQMLVTHWPRELENKAAAKANFKSLSEPSSPITLAYALNRMQHNDNRAALAVVEMLTLRDRANLDAWLLAGYLNILIDNFDRGLIDLQTVKKRLNEDGFLAESQRIETYQWMGRLVGYLQGPVVGKLNPDTLTKTVAAIIKDTAPVELAAFHEQRELILQRYEDSVKTQNQKSQKELADQANKDAQLDATLTNQNQQLATTALQLQQQITQLQSEGSQRIADLTSQASPIESSLASLQTQISSVQFDLQLLYNDLFAAQNVPPGFRPNTWFLQDQIRNAEFTLFSLQGNANAAINQLSGLQAQVAQTRNSYNNQIALLQQQSRTVNGTLLRNQKKQLDIAGGPELADGKKQAITSRLTALSSYVELPVEAYRQQMLDLVK